MGVGLGLAYDSGGISQNAKYQYCGMLNVDSAAKPLTFVDESGKELLLTTLADRANSHFFWFGHGDVGSFGPTPGSAVTVDEAVVGRSLGNTGGVFLLNGEEKGKEAKIEHPYRLVILMACNTWKKGQTTALFPRAFGVDFKESTVEDYLAVGREPRAFVGWEEAIEVPGGTHFLTGQLTDPLDHLHFTQALAALFSRWMAGQPLSNCLAAFAAVAKEHGFVGVDSWRIAGCRDLTINSGL